MKIYRVIYHSVYLDEGENSVTVRTFLNKENALQYIRNEIIEIKKQVEDLQDYCVEESDDYYERYLDGRSSEDSVSIWLEDDETYDEVFLQREQDKKDKDYEI